MGNNTEMIVLEVGKNQMETILEYLTKENIIFATEKDTKFNEKILNKMISLEEEANQKELSNQKFLGDIVFYGTELEGVAVESDFYYNHYSGSSDLQYDNALEYGVIGDVSMEFEKIDALFSIDNIMGWNSFNFNNKFFNKLGTYNLLEKVKMNKIKTIELGNKNG
jgi:hypothetical protein